ncbi:SCO2322 family protein [Streptomyces desertarenae]|uniref:SCO2322 family protein n=1 Tax=Streptomyces desertarenae TaxID=2666184 RepID=A0ABW4PD93_9ACTN
MRAPHAPRTPARPAARAAARAARALPAAALAAALAVAGAAPAHAQGYRYWSFWEREGGAWTYATQGPGTLRPGDGDVLGFRFAVSEDSAEADQPRGEASFEAICGGTGAEPGAKRIALSVDFGEAADAPSGETPPEGRTACAVVPEDGTAAEALAAGLKPLRYGSGALLCAIAGYPRTGCGEQVSGSGRSGGAPSAGTAAGPSGDASGADSGGGPSVGLLVGAGAVAVLGAAAVRQARRRS